MKKKNKLTLQERVDILIDVGVEHPKLWTKVHGYVEPNSGGGYDGWESEWMKLRDHHLEETLFLFEVIKELRQRVMNLHADRHDGENCAEYCYLCRENKVTLEKE